MRGSGRSPYEAANRRLWPNAARCGCPGAGRVRYARGRRFQGHDLGGGTSGIGPAPCRWAVADLHAEAGRGSDFAPPATRESSRDEQRRFRPHRRARGESPWPHRHEHARRADRRDGGSCVHADPGRLPPRARVRRSDARRVAEAVRARRHARHRGKRPNARRPRHGANRARSRQARARLWYGRRVHRTGAGSPPIWRKAPSSSRSSATCCRAAKF